MILQEACINNCSGKFINGNQRIMQTFMEVQSQRQQAMVQEVTNITNICMCD